MEPSLGPDLCDYVRVTPENALPAMPLDRDFFYEEAVEITPHMIEKKRGR